MKRLCLLLFALCFSTGAAAQSDLAEDITGYYRGAIIHAGSIQTMNIDISLRDTILYGRIEIPDFGVLTGPRPMRLVDGHLQFRFMYGNYDLQYDAYEQQLRGAIARNDDKEIRLQFNKGLAPIRPKVTMSNHTYVASGDTISASLFLPEGEGPHPATVIVQGRGYGTRWGQYGECQRMASRGVACFIFDGRGRGQSTGDRSKITEEDRYQDVIGAVELLRGLDDIDNDQIGLWGISAGGWIVPVVAERLGNVAFLVLDVGPSVSLSEQQGHVVEYRMRFSDKEFTEEEYKAGFNYQKRLVELAWEGAGIRKIRRHVKKAKDKTWTEFAADQPDSLDDPELDYFRRRKYDPQPALRKTTIPVFAFYGERDFIVPAQANGPALERLLTEAGNKDFKILSVPDANHGMQIPAFRFVGDEDGEWPHRFFRWVKGAPGLGNEIYGWILDHVTVSDIHKQRLATQN